MTKTAHNDVYDGAFLVLDDANIMTACDTQPTSRAEAITNSGGGGYKLADVAMTPTTDFAKAADASGRKCTMAQKLAVPIDVTGTALFIALCDDTRLLYVTTCTSQLLTSGGTVDFPAWKVNIQAPT